MLLRYHTNHITELSFIDFFTKDSFSCGAAANIARAYKQYVNHFYYSVSLMESRIPSRGLSDCGKTITHISYCTQTFLPSTIFVALWAHSLKTPEGYDFTQLSQNRQNISPRTKHFST